MPELCVFGIIACIITKKRPSRFRSLSISKEKTKMKRCLTFIHAYGLASHFLPYSVVIITAKTVRYRKTAAFQRNPIFSLSLPSLHSHVICGRKEGKEKRSENSFRTFALFLWFYADDSSLRVIYKCSPTSVHIGYLLSRNKIQQRVLWLKLDWYFTS